MSSPVKSATPTIDHSEATVRTAAIGPATVPFMSQTAISLVVRLRQTMSDLPSLLRSHVAASAPPESTRARTSDPIVSRASRAAVREDGMCVWFSCFVVKSTGRAAIGYMVERPVSRENAGASGAP